MQGDVAAVVSEDSDLIVFGCTRVFFKMDNVRLAELQCKSL